MTKPQILPFRGNHYTLHEIDKLIKQFIQKHKKGQEKNTLLYFLFTPLNSTNLPLRITNSLTFCDIYYPIHFLFYTETILNKQKEIGVRSIDEIKVFLKTKELSVGALKGKQILLREKIQGYISQGKTLLQIDILIRKEFFPHIHY